MIIVPVTVAVLVRVNKHYDHVATKLDEPDPELAIATSNRLGAVVLVSRVDEGLDRAMRYVKHLDADRVRAVHVGTDDRNLGAAFWARYGCKLEFVERPELAERVWVKFEGLDAIEGQVCWIDGFVVGIEFVRPMYAAVFDALVPRLRYAPHRAAQGLQDRPTLHACASPTP
jgi:hypothetical protein